MVPPLGIPTIRILKNEMLTRISYFFIKFYKKGPSPNEKNCKKGPSPIEKKINILYNEFGDKNEEQINLYSFFYIKYNYYNFNYFCNTI